MASKKEAKRLCNELVAVEEEQCTGYSALGVGLQRQEKEKPAGVSDKSPKKDNSRNAGINFERDVEITASPGVLASDVDEQVLITELVKTLRTVVKTLRTDVDVLRMENESLTTERDAAKQAHAELVLQLSFWTESLDTVCKLQASKDAETVKLETELKHCKEEMDVMSKQNYTIKMELTAELDALRDSITALKDLNKEIGMVADAFRKEIGMEKRKCINVLKDLNKEIGMVTDAFRQEIGIRIQQIQLLEQKNYVLTEEIESVIEFTAAKDTEATELDRQLKLCKEERTRLAFELDTSRSNAEKLTAELGEANEAVNFLRHIKVKMEEQHDSLVKSLAESGIRLAESKQVIHQLTDICMETSKIVGDQQGEIENVLVTSQQDRMEIEKHITGLIFELDSSRHNAKELTANLDALHQTVAQMEEHNYALIKSLEESEQSILSKENRLNTILQEMDALVKQKDGLIKERDTAVDAHAEIVRRLIFFGNRT